jgi:hypothetical protein
MKVNPELKSIIDDCGAVARSIKDGHEQPKQAIAILANSLATVAEELNRLFNETKNAPDHWPGDMRP